MKSAQDMKGTDIDIQTTYWDSVATTKTFTHPVPTKEFRDLASADAQILDYGCGYGRTCFELVASGFRRVVGVDISAEMIARGQALHPNLDLRHFDGVSLAFANETFDICILLAVLTCIPTDAGQRRALGEIQRVLRPGGIVFISDYPLQPDARNQSRYRTFHRQFGTWGVFRLPDGGIVRHHEMQWISKLLSPFETMEKQSAEIHTMNGNPAHIFQILARKRQESGPAMRHGLCYASEQAKPN